MANQLLNANNIQIVDDVADWQTAVKLASEPLLQTESITADYVTSMIDSVKDNGPYMVLADYFALMHARPGVGVKRIGMSLLVSRKPIDLEGKPVKIFFIMAATDNQSHLESLQKVMSVFMDDASYQTVLSGSKAEIVALFNEMEDLK